MIFAIISQMPCFGEEIMKLRKKKDGSWLVDVGCVKGKRLRLSVATRDEGRELLVSLRGALKEARLSFPEYVRRALKEAWERREFKRGTVAGFEQCAGFYLQELTQGQRSARYVKVLQNFFAQAQKRLGAKNLADVTTTKLRDFVHDESVTVVTRHNRLRDMGAFLRWCVKRGFMSSDPSQEVPRLRVRGREPVLLSPDQAEALLEECRLEWRAGLAVLLFAGLRPVSELLGLRWDDVGEAGIVVRSEKTGRRRLVPIEKNLRLWLCERGAGRVMLPGWDRERQRICRVTGIKWVPDITRHSCASYWLAREQDAGRVALWLGNSPGVLLRHYQVLTTLDVALRWFSVVPSSRSRS